MSTFNKYQSKIRAIIVIPCFNEEQYLQSTCNSLGFGLGKNIISGDSTLIIVNNNSTDTTQIVAEQIKNNSPTGTVYIIPEKEKGFVPARHAGNCAAEKVAQSEHCELNNVLILQADADTHYSENYVNFIKAKAETVGTNFLIEARVDYPYFFKSEYPAYIGLCNEIDNKFFKLFPSDRSEDMILDDKATSYRLGDYFYWGGHSREYDSAGEEVYAETTRLYLKARAKGAKRILVDTACAVHSVRKILSNPLMHFATAGFPFEMSWNSVWNRNHSDIINLHSLISHSNHLLVSEAINIREKHLLALFCILPIHVNQTINEESSTPITNFSNLAITLLPKRSLQNLSLQSCVFLTDVLALVHNYGDMLIKEACQFCLE